MWVLDHSARFAAEDRAFDELAARAPWFRQLRWSATGEGFAYEFDIDLGDRVFDGRLTYPDLFPHIPPTVRPRTPLLWTSHQYGAAGELCLERGSDNWTADVTGAEMVESAYRLLSAEVGTSAGGLSIVPVPSRHELTLGQELRSKRWRFLVTAALRSRLEEVANARSGQFWLRFRPGDDNLGYLVSLGEGEDSWPDRSLPASLENAAHQVSGHVVRLAVRPEGLSGDPLALRLQVLGEPPPSGMAKEFLLCLLPGGELLPLLLYHLPELNRTFEFTVIHAGAGGRLPPDYGVLAGRSVGLAGCGSLGGKIAAGLVRSGVGKFVLVDDDVLLPENLVRNELDWSSVGRMKTEALAERLDLIRPGVDVVTKNFRLGGQESSAALASVARQLADCDLLIDATAAPAAFNYVAAAAGRRPAPMLWAQVFAGGFGGFVAQARPGVEPAPQLVRNRIEDWCKEHRAELPRAAADYGGILAGVPMFADDTAVSVVAAHASALALDLLLPRTPPRFAYAAYMMGLAEGWIFKGVFDTWPVIVDPAPPAVDIAAPPDADTMGALQRLIRDLGDADRATVD